jgi:hypothetical protein
MAERLPFHRSIVDILRETPNNFDVINFVAELIKRTEISENHDAIIEAWRGLLDRTGRIDSSGLTCDLQIQKYEAGEEAERKWKAEQEEIYEDAREDCN